MGEVIKFGEFKNSQSSDSFEDHLKQAYQTSQRKLLLVADEFGAKKAAELKDFFEIWINEQIFSENLLSRDIFLCGAYISQVLAEVALSGPKSWWAIDYFGSDDPLVAKKGGDVCFTICGIFPERGNYRLMDISYYMKMGRSFYQHFFSLTKKEIGLHMSHQFETMAGVVQRCVKKFLRRMSVSKTTRLEFQRVV